MSKRAKAFEHRYRYSKAMALNQLCPLLGSISASEHETQDDAKVDDAQEGNKNCTGTIDEDQEDPNDHAKEGDKNCTRTIDKDQEDATADAATEGDKNGKGAAGVKDQNCAGAAGDKDQKFAPGTKTRPAAAPPVHVWKRPAAQQQKCARPPKKRPAAAPPRRNAYIMA